MSVQERARLAVEYGVEASAGRGGWLADPETLQVRVWSDGGWLFVCHMYMPYLPASTAGGEGSPFHSLPLAIFTHR